MQTKYFFFAISNSWLDNLLLQSPNSFSMRNSSESISQAVHFHIIRLIFLSGHLTSKSDVYSFGVVLLEILTGRRSMDKKRPSGEQNLVTWARPYLSDKRKVYQLVDPRLELNYSIKGVQKVAQLAYNCLSRDTKSRPLMDEVVKVLTPLQELNDLAILSYHSRFSQAGRRRFSPAGRREKKPDGIHQLNSNQSKSIRDSPLTSGQRHCK